MKPIGVAIIGASHRSTMIFNYLKRFPSQGSIVSVCDIVPARAEYLIDEYGSGSKVKLCSSASQAMNDPAVDAVFIGTPDHAHAEPVVTALNAGKHVYCEKPFAITLEDCDAMLQAAKSGPGVFYLGMNLRHGPVYETIHEVISSGELGKMLTIEANVYYYGGRSYFRRWNRLREFGGGLWITKACHDFDLLNWFSGGKPTSVYAISSLSHYKPIAGAGTHCRVCGLKDSCPDYYDTECPANRVWDKLGELSEQANGQPRDLCLYNSDKDTFDNGVAVVEYDNDIRTTLVVNVVASRSTRQVRILGTESSLESDMDKGIVIIHRRHCEQKTTHDLSKMVELSSHGGADDRVLSDFFRCCRTGDKPRSSWADGRLSVQVGLAARESADSGQPVILEH